MRHQDTAEQPLSPLVVAGLLQASLRTVEAELAALAGGLHAWRPAPGEWCANEVVGHLIEAERRGFAGRIRQILAGQPMEDWDPPAVAEERRDCARDGLELVAEFRRTRTESIALVGQLTADDLAHSGEHPFVGALYVRDLLHEWVFHDRAHLQQLLENTKQFVWPSMGNARRFSAPDSEA